MVIDESMSGYQRPRHFIVFKSFGIQQSASEPTNSQAHQKRDGLRLFVRQLQRRPKIAKILSRPR